MLKWLELVFGEEVQWALVLMRSRGERGRRRRERRERGESSALQRHQEAASAVHGFGAGRLRSLPPQLLPAQGATQARVGRLVLLIERRCRQNKTKRDGHQVLHLSTLMQNQRTFLMCKNVQPTKPCLCMHI